MGGSLEWGPLEGTHCQTSAQSVLDTLACCITMPILGAGNAPAEFQLGEQGAQDVVT